MYLSIVRNKTMRLKELERLYAKMEHKIRNEHKLKHVVIPKLYNHQNKPNISGLSFLFFYINLSKIVTKKELTIFLRKFGCCKINPPNPRHFGMQYGFYFLVRGSFHPRYRRVLKPGEYSLYSIAKEHPNVIQNNCHHRTCTISKQAFNQLKFTYESRCTVCGSQENTPNFKNKTVKTTLEMGHMDPAQKLTIQNCIPICSICNQVYKNQFVFNKRGFIVRHINGAI